MGRRRCRAAPRRESSPGPGREAEHGPRGLGIKEHVRGQSRQRMVQPHDTRIIRAKVGVQCFPMDDRLGVMVAIAGHVAANDRQPVCEPGQTWKMRPKRNARNARRDLPRGAANALRGGHLGVIRLVLARPAMLKDEDHRLIRGRCGTGPRRGSPAVAKATARPGRACRSAENRDVATPNLSCRARASKTSNGTIRAGRYGGRDDHTTVPHSAPIIPPYGSDMDCPSSEFQGEARSPCQFAARPV